MRPTPQAHHGSASPAAHGAPARILTDARVWTGAPGSPPRALPGRAIAIRGGRILAEGPASDILQLRGPGTVVEPLEGRTVLPGFVDAHVHLLSGGLEFFRLQLRGVRSPADLTARVAGRSRATPGSGWILGGGWDHHVWGGTLPTREWLDRAAPERPVFLLRVDLHMGLANSEALRRAGIDARTPDPARGTIDRDPATGEPTGILREEALELMARVVPPPTESQREAGLMAAARHALSLGVTQVHDMGALQSPDESWASLDALRRLRGRGQLPIRVQAAVPLETRHRMAELVASEGTGDLRLAWGSVKGFVDGSLGAGTAWLNADYEDTPGHAGGPATDPEALEAHLLEAAGLGLRPVVHAIGDRATDWLLDVFEQVDPALRPRIEHAQHMTPEGIGRAGRLGTVVSMQPAHLLDDGQWVHRRLGLERPRWAFPFRSLAAAGAHLAFGSDWTVVPMDPRLALAAAVHRIPGQPHRDGASGGRSPGTSASGTASGAPPGDHASHGTPWNPAERIGLHQALVAHTRGGAYAARWEDQVGTIEPGMAADLVVLDRDPFEVDPVRLPVDPRVHLTFVDGTLAWRSDEAPEESLT